MFYRKYLRSGFALPLSVVSFTCSPVLAQISDEPDKIEEVIVVAPKYLSNSFDLPVAVSVLNERQLKDFGVRNINDVAAQTPGFFALNTGTRNPDPLVIRGINMRADNHTGNDLGSNGETVAVYFDNVPLQPHFVPPQISTIDIEGVDIYRGPQGTLFGASSLSGLVQYSSKKADVSKWGVELHGGSSYTAKSNDPNYVADVVVNAPIVEDVFAFRLAAGYQNWAGYIDNDELLGGPQDDINKEEQNMVRGSVGWQMDPTSRLDVSYHYQSDNVSDRDASNPEFTGDDYKASWRYIQPLNNELNIASIDYVETFKDFQMRLSVNDYRQTTSSKVDQTDYFHFLDELFQSEFYQPYNGFATNHLEVKQQSAELRFASILDVPVRWQTGMYYNRLELYSLGQEIVEGLSDDHDWIVTDVDYIASQRAVLYEGSVYADVTFDAGDKVELSVGSRGYFNNDVQNACTALPATSGETPDVLLDGCSKTPVKQDFGVLFRGAALYKVADNARIYANISQGYRRGGANNQRSNTSSQTYAAYQPETTVNYEIGYRLRTLENNFFLTAALFYIDWNDIQLPFTTPALDAVTINGGKAFSEGIELEMSVVPVSGLDITAGLSLTNARLAENLPEGTGDGMKDDKLPYSPSTLANIRINYQWNALGLDWYTNLRGNYVGEVSTTISQSSVAYRELPDYALFYYTLGLAQNAWQVQLFVDNIANTRAVTGYRSDYYFGKQGQFEYITRPRTAGVDFRYQF